MAKFKLLRGLLLDCGLVQEQQFNTPLSIARRDLELVHDRRYQQAFCRGELTRQEQRRIGLPATRPLVQRTWLAVGGTLLTARLALRNGLACHLAGGTHHAHPSFGSGFCIFNDCAVAAAVLLAETSACRKACTCSMPAITARYEFSVLRTVRRRCASSSCRAASSSDLA